MLALPYLINCTFSCNSKVNHVIISVKQMISIPHLLFLMQKKILKPREKQRVFCKRIIVLYKEKCLHLDITGHKNKPENGAEIKMKKYILLILCCKTKVSALTSCSDTTGAGISSLSPFRVRVRVKRGGSEGKDGWIQRDSDVFVWDTDAPVYR